MIKEVFSRFGRKLSFTQKKKESEDVLEIAGAVSSLMDKAVMDIFLAYSRILLTEPITYIVPAVWGATKGGELDETQKEMHMRILPSLNKMIELLDIKGLSNPQVFAIGFLLRGLVISKITYLIESFRNQTAGINMVEKPNDYMLHVKPMGTA